MHLLILGLIVIGLLRLLSTLRGSSSSNPSSSNRLLV